MTQQPPRIEKDFANAEKRNDKQVLTDAETEEVMDLLIKIMEAHKRKPWGPGWPENGEGVDPEVIRMMDRVDELLEKRERGLCDA